MSMQDSPVFCHLLVDTQSKTERTTEAILKQNGWKFIQDGRYTEASPLVIPAGTKQKITFSLTQLAYQDGRLLDVEYDQATNTFRPKPLGSTYLLNFRLKCKPSAQNGTADAALEVNGAAFNPVLAGTLSFNKAANQQHFFSLTDPVFVSQDMLDNGFSVYIQPFGTSLSVYDYSFFLQKTFIP